LGEFILGNEKDQIVSDIQRNAIAAQWSFDAAIKAYEAAAISGNEELMKSMADSCHESLDVWLSCKQALFSEHLTSDFKFM
jgi:hypothetical protein